MSKTLACMRDAQRWAQRGHSPCSAERCRSAESQASTEHKLLEAAGVHQWVELECTEQVWLEQRGIEGTAHKQGEVVCPYPLHLPHCTRL